MKSSRIATLLFTAFLFADIASSRAASALPEVVGPAQITDLSAFSVDRSGYLEITGTNFGTDGSNLIGGLVAPIADRQDTKIVAYVPETAALGASSVQVVNSSGSPNAAVALTVTARREW